MPTLRLGTRRSQLAQIQSRRVADRLEALGHRVKWIYIRTRGDVHTERPLYGMGGRGLFVKELERALLEDRIDLAVHSAKDVPTELAPGLVLAAYLPREQPWDLYISPHAPLEQLPAGARIGTSSLRRMAMLRAHRPDLQPVPIRGNVDTRLRKLLAGHVDALILAVSGVARLGLLETDPASGLRVRVDRLAPGRPPLAATVLRPPAFVPAAGQGAIAVETRADSPWLSVLHQLDNPDTRVCVETERALMRRLQGGCHLPAGIYAEPVTTPASRRIRLWVRLLAPEGHPALDLEVSGDDPEALASAAHARLQAQPAYREIMARLNGLAPEE